MLHRGRLAIPPLGVRPARPLIISTDKSGQTQCIARILGWTKFNHITGSFRWGTREHIYSTSL